MVPTALDSNAAVASGSYEPSLGTIDDEPAPLPQSATTSNLEIPASEAAADLSNDANIMKSVVNIAAKLDASRKYSQSLSIAEDEEDDDFVPHFQRVFISGDDNTGVSQSIFYD